METINLYVRAVLKHVLSEPKPLDSEEDSDDTDIIEDETPSKIDLKLVNKQLSEENDRVKAIKRQRMMMKKKKRYSSSAKSGVELLDFSGPKLITGFENWLLFYKICGQINWVGKPLYLSIVYKFIALAWMSYTAARRTVSYYELDAVKSSLKNPILIFILFLGCVAQIVQMILVFLTNLTNLSPVYKILETPKLCFLKGEVLHKLGTKSLRLYLIVGMFHSIIASMIGSRDLNQYIERFSFPAFILETYGSFVYLTYVTSILNIDLYIRSAFGHWLLALQCYLEQRFTHLHRHQRRMNRLKARQRLINRTSMETSNCSNSPGDNQPDSSQASQSGSSMQQPLIAFDEIQKNLNQMDDYLELFRDVQVSCLLLISLMAFLINGSLFLLSYRLLADKKDFYHGVLFVLLGLSFLLQFLFSYFGDSWLYYALSSFAQTMEDEYFTQNELIIKTSTIINNNSDSNKLLSNQAASSMIVAQMVENSPISIDDSISELADTKIYDSSDQQQQLMLIKKKDVLFCREFLHQFENHLGTPWSKLTFITHIHLLRAFVTLIAAQIIFDEEH